MVSPLVQMRGEPLVRLGDDIAGKYRVTRVVGEGGMAWVYEVAHESLGESFAMKVLKPDTLARPDAARRFLGEARAAATLKSEHVVRVLDVGTDTTLGVPYMVMELLEGQDLADLLHQRGPIPVQQAVAWVLEALEAISEAHAAGIVHRDLKPSNLFLARAQDGRQVVKVLDFGVSKAGEALSVEASASTSTNRLLGTPAYMSPEQLRSSRDVDARSDVWAIGVVLYELVSGTLPFDAETIGALYAAVFESDAPLLRTRRPDAPAELEAILKRCLEKRAARRYPNVTELAEALTPLAGDTARTSLDNIKRRSLPLLLDDSRLDGKRSDTLAMQDTLDMGAARPASTAPISKPPPGPETRTTGPLLAAAAVAIGLLVVGIVLFANGRRSARDAETARETSSAVPAPTPLVTASTPPEASASPPPPIAAPTATTTASSTPTTIARPATPRPRATSTSTSAAPPPTATSAPTLLQHNRE